MCRQINAQHHASVIKRFLYGENLTTGKDIDVTGIHNIDTDILLRKKQNIIQRSDARGFALFIQLLPDTLVEIRVFYSLKMRKIGLPICLKFRDRILYGTKNFITLYCQTPEILWGHSLSGGSGHSHFHVTIDPCQLTYKKERCNREKHNAQEKRHSHDHIDCRSLDRSPFFHKSIPYD